MDDTIQLFSRLKWDQWWYCACTASYHIMHCLDMTGLECWVSWCGGMLLSLMVVGEQMLGVSGCNKILQNGWLCLLSRNSLQETKGWWNHGCWVTFSFRVAATWSLFRSNWWPSFHWMNPSLLSIMFKSSYCAQLYMIPLSATKHLLLSTIRRHDFLWVIWTSYEGFPFASTLRWVMLTVNNTKLNDNDHKLDPRCMDSAKILQLFVLLCLTFDV